MPKQYKIKRHRKYSGAYRAKPHPLSVILWILGIAALVFVGICIYNPVYNYIMGNHSLPEPSSQAEPDSSAVLPEESSASEPEEEPEPEPLPASTTALRTAYLPTATVTDPAALTEFLAGLENTPVNAVMVDIKSTAGMVLFQTQNAQAAQWGAVSPTAFDLGALANTLEEKELSLVVRMSAFRDPVAASVGRENAIRYRDSEWLWLDNTAERGGKPWLNPYAPGSRGYLTALAVEAADAGAKMVVLENVQFPAGSEANAAFGNESANVGRSQVLQTFVADFTSILAEKGTRTAVYFPAISLTQEYENLARYGGNPLAIAGENVIVGALPYQFGGDFSAAGLAVTQPMQNPAAALSEILKYVPLKAGTTTPFTTIPLLQGGSEVSVNTQAIPYTKTMLDSQLAVMGDPEKAEYILYQTGGMYLLK